MSNSEPQVFTLLEKLFDHLTNFEPRLRKLEFRVNVMWALGFGLLTMVLLPITIHVGKKVVDALFMAFGG